MATASPTTTGTTLAAEPHAFRNEEDLQEAYHANGWTDGLPIVAPTPERVEAFLAAAGLEPGELLGEVPTREVRVTAEQAAINVVMAGCLPEYFPVADAVVRAHLNEKATVNWGSSSGRAQVWSSWATAVSLFSGGDSPRALAKISGN